MNCQNVDEETGCSVGDYTISSRRRWNYENNCAAIICYASTGLATSSTQLTDLSDDIIQHHHQLAQNLTVGNVNEILEYTVNKLLKAKGAPSPISIEKRNSISNNDVKTTTTTTSTQRPAIHLKIFYQVSATPPIDLIVRTVADFCERHAHQISIAFTVLPASSLQNFSTFLSICGIRHE